jgi:hypothetical protein
MTLMKHPILMNRKEMLKIVMGFGKAFQPMNTMINFHTVMVICMIIEGKTKGEAGEMLYYLY